MLLNIASITANSAKVREHALIRRHNEIVSADAGLLGEGLQMLLYLFALRRSDTEKYGKNPEPAGVLYVRGRNSMLRVENSTDQPEADRLHREQSRRKGLLRDDRELLLAMEDSEKPEYLPVTVKKDEYVGDLASKQQMDMLSADITARVSMIIMWYHRFIDIF